MLIDLVEVVPLKRRGPVVRRRVIPLIDIVFADNYERLVTLHSLVEEDQPLVSPLD